MAKKNICRAEGCGGTVDAEANACLKCGMEPEELTIKPKGGWQKPLPVFHDLGPNVPPFEKYFDEHIELIKRVQGLLACDLGDSPAEMDRNVREIEKYHASMASVLAWADSYLDAAENAKLLPKGNGWTDLDRETALAAACARERRFRDVVKGILESMQQRISYAQTRLRAFSEAEGQRFGA
jgi:hypothetical protein